LFYLITDRDCVALSSINIRTSTPPKDEFAVVRPSDRNSDAHGQARIDRPPMHQIHVVAVLIRLPPPDPAIALITPPPH
jgi:hypothetical protein